MRTSGLRPGHLWGQVLRNVMSVLAVYALVLQVLLPLSAATATAAESGNGVPVYCKLMLDARTDVGKSLPMTTAHDCGLCCLQSSATADLPRASVVGVTLLPAEPAAFFEACLEPPMPARGAPPSLRGPPAI